MGGHSHPICHMGNLIRVSVRKLCVVAYVWPQHNAGDGQRHTNRRASSTNTKSERPYFSSALLTYVHAFRKAASSRSRKLAARSKAAAAHVSRRRISGRAHGETPPDQVQPLPPTPPAILLASVLPLADRSRSRTQSPARVLTGKEQPKKHNPRPPVSEYDRTHRADRQIMQQMLSHRLAPATQHLLCIVKTTLRATAVIHDEDNRPENLSQTSEPRTTRTTRATICTLRRT